MEKVFETIETSDFDMKTTSSSNRIEPIFNRNFGNALHNHNRSNQIQHGHKHKFQQYQSRPFQISKTLLPTYLKEKYFGCGFDNSEVIELLIHRYVK